jgi:hypothetical protein
MVRNPIILITLVVVAASFRQDRNTHDKGVTELLTANVLDGEDNKAEQDNTSESTSASMCKCWFGLFHPAEECCDRTDRGTATGDKPKCTVKPDLLHCSAFCASESKCGNVPHKFDKVDFWTYAKEKVSEVSKMGKADILLAQVAIEANTNEHNITKMVIPVKSIKSVHPVGEWRENTWQKTLKRKHAVLAGKDILKANNYTLTAELIFAHDVFAPLQSVGNFIAVPFGFHGYSYVTLEGNGRLKGIALAALDDPELGNLQVEVDFLEHKTDAVRRNIQAAILKLWNQYVTEAQAFPPGNDVMFRTYMGFRLPVIKCRGFSTLEHRDGNSGAVCPIVDGVGVDPRDDTHLITEVNAWSMWDVVGAVDAQNMETLQFQNTHANGRRLTYYQLKERVHEKVAYLVGDSGGNVVKEYCPSCIDYGGEALSGR